MVAHAEGEIPELWTTLDVDDPEDHAEAPGRLGEVDLGAVGQHGPVPSVLLYAARVLERNPVPFVVPSGGFGCLAPGRRAACEVFLPGILIEVRREAAPAASGHGLRLVVGREHVGLVLAPELGGLLRGQLTAA